MFKKGLPFLGWSNCNPTATACPGKPQGMYAAAAFSQQQVLKAVSSATTVTKGGMQSSGAGAVPSMTPNASTCSNPVSIPPLAAAPVKPPVDRCAASLAVATTSPRNMSPAQHVSRHVPRCGAQGARGTRPLSRGIQQIPDEECSHLLFRHSEAAAYFNAAQHMLYHLQGVVDIRTP